MGQPGKGRLFVGRCSVPMSGFKLSWRGKWGHSSSGDSNGNDKNDLFLWQTTRPTCSALRRTSTKSPRSYA